jgi:hypothetical protein
MRSRWMALALLFAAACLVAGCTGSGRFLQVQKFGTETELRTFCQQRGEMVELEMRVNDAENPTTFEQAYLKDGTGRMIFPSTINVIEEWGEATVWVRWSATKYQNGVPVWHNEGESFDSWSWRNPTKVTRADGEPVVEMPPAIWERLKRKTPAEGPRCVKLLFKIPKEEIGKLVSWTAHIELAEVVEKDDKEEVVKTPADFEMDYHKPKGEEQKDDKQAEDIWKEIELTKK